MTMSLFITSLVLTLTIFLSTNAVPVPQRRLLPNIHIGTVVQSSQMPIEEIVSSLISGVKSGKFIVAEPIASTQIGSDNGASSNADILRAVDHTVSSFSIGWVDTYSDFLLDVANATVGSEDLDDNENFVKKYDKTMEEHGGLQTKVIAAYDEKHPGNGSTGVGNTANGANEQLTTLAEMEQWVEAQFNVSDTKKIGNLTKSDFAKYQNVTSVLDGMRPRWKDLSETLKMSDLGSRIQSTIRSYPGTFNFSMVTGGDIQSPEAVFGPAWSATVINTTDLTGNYSVLTQNLNNGLGTATVNDPTAGLDSTNSSALSSTLARSTALSSTSIPSSSTVVSSSKAVPSPSPSPKIRKRGGIQAAWNQTHSSSVGGNTPSEDKSLSSVGQLAEVADVAAMPNSVETAQINSQAILLLLKLQPGTWIDNIDEFIRYSFSQTPETVVKYFGNGTNGGGPIGQYPTHLVLSALPAITNPSSMGELEVVGAIWEVLPVLNGLPWSTLNSTSSEA